MISASSGVSVLWFSKTYLATGAYNEPHTHDFYHISYVLQGQVGEIPAGHIIIHAPGVIHELRVCECDAIVIEFKCILTDRELTCALDRLGPAVAMHPGLAAFLEGTASDMIAQPLGTETLNVAINYFLYRLVEVTHRAEFTPNHKGVEAVCNYMRQNFTNPITLDDMARHAGFSRNYLSSLFHREMGVTLVEYLSRLRIRKACELIAYDDMPVSEACKACGFGDLHNFGRTFKRLVGVSPGRYRRAYDTEAMNFVDNRVPDIPLREHRCFSYAADAQKLAVWDSVAAYYRQTPADGPNPFVSTQED